MQLTLPTLLLLRASHSLSTETTLSTNVAGFPATCALLMPDRVVLPLEIAGSPEALLQPDRVALPLEIDLMPPPEELLSMLRPDREDDACLVAPALVAEPDCVEDLNLMAPALDAEPELEDILVVPSLVAEPDREDALRLIAPPPNVESSSSDIAKAPSSLQASPVEILRNLLKQHFVTSKRICPE